MSTQDYHYKKGDFVLAECSNDMPWPAIISRILPNNIYKVSFVSHKTIAHIEQQFLQPFKEQVIQKYCAELQTNNPYHRRILKAIEDARQTKIKMEKRFQAIRERDHQFRLKRDEEREQRAKTELQQKYQAEMGEIAQHEEVLEESNRFSRKVDFAAEKQIPFQFHFTHHLNQPQTSGGQSVSTFKKEDDLITADQSKDHIVQDKFQQGHQEDNHTEQIEEIPIVIDQQPQEAENQPIQENAILQLSQQNVQEQVAEEAVVFGPPDIADLSTAASLNQSHIIDMPFEQPQQQWEEDIVAGNSHLSTAPCLSHSNHSQHIEWPASPQRQPIPLVSFSLTNYSNSIENLPINPLPQQALHSNDDQKNTFLVHNLEDEGKKHFFQVRAKMNQQISRLIRQLREQIVKKDSKVVNATERRQLVGLLEAGREWPADADVVREMIEFVEEVEGNEEEKKSRFMVQYYIVRERLQHYCDLGRFIALDDRVISQKVFSLMTI